MDAAHLPVAPEPTPRPTLEEQPLAGPRAAWPWQTRPPHQHAPSWASDPVTGLALADARKQGVQHVKRWRDYDITRDEAHRAPIPTSMHTSRMDKSSGSDAARKGDYAGAFEFSPAFVRYAGKVTAKSVEQERTQLRRWWSVPYVFDRVCAHFVHSDKHCRAITAIVAMHRDHVDTDVVVEMHGFATLTQLLRIERHILLYVKTAYGLPGEVPPETQTWHAADNGGASLVASLFGDQSTGMTTGESAG